MKDIESLKKLLEVFRAVDGGCSVCCRKVIEDFFEKFPECKPDMMKLIKLEKAYPFDDQEWLDDLINA